MRFQIENPIDREFGMVPRALWKMALPFSAKALAAYLFCLRDGAMPYVAEIEADCGIGRDARRKGFAALEAAGLIRWQVQSNSRGLIVGKTLVINAAACMGDHAPDNQADGQKHHAPDNPAGGFSVDLSTENNLRTDCGSGDTLKEKKERAASARAKIAKGVIARASGRDDRRQRPAKIGSSDIAAAHAALSHPATSEVEKAEIWDWLAKVQPSQEGSAYADPS